MKKIISFILLFATTLWSFDIMIGAGGFDVKKYKGSYSFKDKNPKGVYTNITEVLQKQSKNVNAVSIWITRDWKEEWYSAKEVQKNIINKGYIPIYVFYWFADDISPEFVQKNEKKYFDTLKKFTKYIKKIDGKKIVILNPEYNMSGCQKWDEMNDIFLKSFKIIRDDSQTLVGPCVGDFGDYTYTNEPKEWKLFDKSLKRAAKEADFIAFQEMRALTRNSKKDILRTSKRALYFSKYLHKKYKKPTALAYIAISSYGKNGKKIQAEVYKSFVKLLPKMKKEAKLILFNTFHYFDYPGHTGYFNEAEEFFGLVEKNGRNKPSLYYFNKLH